jgi:tetratricopeptide (TPR) repeat protein
MLTPRRLASVAVAVALSLSALLGCDSLSLKYIRFPVKENGRTVEVQKFYNDGIGLVPEQGQAYEAAARGDFNGAERLLRRALERLPEDEWTWYDLAIIHEAQGEWDKAEDAIKNAIKWDLDNVKKGGKGKKGKGPSSNLRPNNDFQKELDFIQAHKRGR